MELTLPDDLALALDAAGVRTIFETMAASQRSEWLRTIADAANPTTREQRIADCVAAMRTRLETRG